MGTGFVIPAGNIPIGNIGWHRPRRAGGCLSSASARAAAAYIDIAEMIQLRPFQRRFLARALAPRIDTAALSIPRGNGKSTLSAHILERCLTPTDPLFEAGAEYLLGAASLEQARNVYRPLRAALEPKGGYRFIDSVTRLGITHKASNTKLRVMSSNAKAAFGIVGTPLAVLDEPGAWEVNGGELMHSALVTAQGKPGSRLRLIFVGTLAPASAGWWHDMIDSGTHGSVYVQALKGDRAKWDQWPEIRRVNPLMSRYPESRAKLLEERNDARVDGRLKARFMSYRLNLPTADEEKVLLTVSDWERMEQRPTPERAGPAIVGVDLGGRAGPGAPPLRSGRMAGLRRWRSLRVFRVWKNRNAGTASLLAPIGPWSTSGGSLWTVGLRVQSTAALWAAVREQWGIPALVICDRFRLGELLDAVQDVAPVDPRVTRWSDASFDIRALRKLVKDGPLSVSQESRSLIAASLSVAVVKSDDQGSTRLVKGSNNTARDDVAAALLLAAGAYMRDSQRPAPTVTHVVV